jgi:hypothetical protein
LLHWFGRCIPEVIFVVLFGLAKVFLLKEDLFDVLSAKAFVSNFFIMRNEIFISLVAQIFNILKGDGLIFIVDRTQEALELVSGL